MSENEFNPVCLDEDYKYLPIGQGNTAEILEYSDNLILKLFRKEIPREAAEHEWQCVTAIQEKFADTPRALRFVEYKGRYGILYEKISGTDMINIALTQPLKLKEYGEILADIHLKMHEINIQLPDDLHSKLARDIRNGTGLSEEEKQRVIDMLEQLPKKYFLCHFDYHPGNVMVTEDKYYVIDWMTACAGDPAADVARFVLLMTLGEPLYADSAKRMLISAGMNKIKKSYLEKYLFESGFEYEDIEEWLVPVAAARLSERLTDHERENLIQLVRDGIC